MTNSLWSEQDQAIATEWETNLKPAEKWKILKEVIIKLIKRYVLTDNDLFQCGQECEAIPSSEVTNTNPHATRISAEHGYTVTNISAKDRQEENGSYQIC